MVTMILKNNISLFVSYNMIGNIKFSLIIIAGYIIFKDQIKYEQFFAIALVMLGKLV